MSNPVEDIIQLARISWKILVAIPVVGLSLTVIGGLLRMPGSDASTQETMSWSTSLVNSTVHQSVDASMPMTASFLLNPGKVIFGFGVIFLILLILYLRSNSGGRY